MERTAKPGDAIVYVDSTAVARAALVTTSGGSWVNLVVVSTDETRSDSYGRQIERQTSVVHHSRQEAPGNYWRWADEQPKPTER